MKKQINDQSVILHQLKRTRNADYPLHLRHAVSGIPLISGAFIQPYPRLIIILSGSKNISLPFLGGAESIHLTQGDAFFADPNAWECYNWDTTCQMLCIVPREAYLRVSYYEQDSPESGKPEAFFFHTSQPYSAGLGHVLQTFYTMKEDFHEKTGIHLAKALIEFSISELDTEHSSSKSKAHSTFQLISQWIENRFQEDIDRYSAAKTFEVSPSYVSQLFKKMTGSGFHHYLSHMRIKVAKQLLTTTNLTVKQVADQCGFNNYVHFVRRFRELEGMPPGQYQSQNR